MADCIQYVEVVEEPVYVQVNPDIIYVQVVEQGPTGPPGADGGGGGSSSSVLTKTASVSLGGNRAVRTDVATGKMVYADNTVTPTAESVLGITTGAAIANMPVEVQIFGEMEEASWSWTPGLPIYLSINGLLTQTAPTTGSVTQIGVALTATSILIRIQEMVLLA